MTWKHGLRLVNGISLADAATLLRETDDRVIRQICVCRLERPAEYVDLLQSAGIIPLEERSNEPVAGANLTSKIAGALLGGWVTLEEVAVRVGKSRQRVQQIVSMLPNRRALAIETRRQPGVAAMQYRAIPAVPA